MTDYIDKLTRLCNHSKYGNPLTNINITHIAEEMKKRMRNDCTIEEENRELSYICVNLTTSHNDYELLASRIHIDAVHENTPFSLYSMIMKISHSESLRLSQEFIEIVHRADNKISQVMKPSRDFNLRIFGYQTLARSYLMKAPPNIIERPHHFYMRIALAIFVCQPDGLGHLANELTFRVRLKDAFEFYDALSTQLVSNATPTLLNSGTNVPQLSSCFQLATGDDLGTLFDTVKSTAMINKWSGGTSLWLHNVRGEGQLIKKTGGLTSGISRYIKILNDVQLYVDQGGNRPGATAVYLSVDHSDIFTFLSIARLKGEESLNSVNSPDLKYALWVSDLFMRVLEEQIEYENGNSTDSTAGDWYIFSPDKAPDLHLFYGDDYENLYNSYVAQGNYVKKVKAGDIIKEAFKTWVQVGTPYVLFKDSINKKSNMKNVAPISSSNLCVSGDTQILTSNGYQAIGGLVGQRVNIWNGFEWSHNILIHKTNDAADLLELRFENSERTFILHCTPYHKFYDISGQEYRAAELTPDIKLEIMPIKPDNCQYDNYDDLKFVSSHPLPGKHETFCFTEPIRNRGVFNGIYCGQCCEITIPSWSNIEANLFSNFHKDNKNGGEFGVCNLAAICLETCIPTSCDKPNFEFFENISNAVKLEVKVLNKIIDLNFYATEECMRSNTRHRPIGIGIMGLADVFARFKLPYGSEKSIELARAIAAVIYYSAVKESCAAAEQLGRSYSTFEDSPISQGILQPDMWSSDWESSTGGYLEPSHWDELRKNIKSHGVLNAYVTAYMPTATTSNIVGQNECFEPFTSNIYTRKTMAGEFLMVNKHLVNQLSEMKLWTPETQHEVILAGGSIQNINSIPIEIKKLYKTARELSSSAILKVARAMAPFICQSMSMNLFLNEPDLSKIIQFLLRGWKMGLKTGMYYCHTKPAAGSQKSEAKKNISCDCSSCDI